MKIRVNPDLCQGHNRCCTLAPDLFEVDDYGFSSALNNGDVPAGKEGEAQLCIDSCPEFAIELVEDK